MSPEIELIIPVYNEKNTIDEILRRVLDTEPRKEVIVVDDCSTDGTRQILENMAARQANGRRRQRRLSQRLINLQRVVVSVVLGRVGSRNGARGV